MVKCNLTSIPQAFHILGFLTSSRCGIVHASRAWPGSRGSCRSSVRSSRSMPVTSRRTRVPGSSAGSELTRGHERQALEAHQILAQHHRLERAAIPSCSQPAQAPVGLHGALVLVVARVGDLESAQRREQRVGVARERRPAAAQRRRELPLVDEVDVAAQRRAHPGVAGHAQPLVRLGVHAQAHLAGRLHAVDGGDVALGEQLAPGASWRGSSSRRPACRAARRACAARCARARPRRGSCSRARRAGARPAAARLQRAAPRARASRRSSSCGRPGSARRVSNASFSTSYSAWRRLAAIGTRSRRVWRPRTRSPRAERRSRATPPAARRRGRARSARPRPSGSMVNLRPGM